MFTYQYPDGKSFNGAIMVATEDMPTLSRSMYPRVKESSAYLDAAVGL